MKTYLRSSIVLSLLLLTWSACKNDKNDNTPQCVAGTGGSVSLTFEPQHHGKAIYNQPNYPDSAWLKFNTGEYAGDDPSGYDLIVTGITGSNQVTVDGLKCGKYYIYMTGFDTSIVERVRGGIPISVDQSSGSRTIIVPVTED